MAKGAARPRGTPDSAKFDRILIGFPPEMADGLRRLSNDDEHPIAWHVRNAVAAYLYRETRKRLGPRFE